MMKLDYADKRSYRSRLTLNDLLLAPTLLAVLVGLLIAIARGV